jgi:hypothetical protein
VLRGREGGEHLGCLRRQDFQGGLSDVQLQLAYSWDEGRLERVEEPDPPLLREVKGAAPQEVAIAMQIDVEQRCVSRIRDHRHPWNVAKSVG